MQEIIKPIPSLPSYGASNTGYIFSKKRYKDWRRLKGRPDTYGRLRISVSYNGKITEKLVHRLVLEAFVGPCPNGMEGCHYNGNCVDNSVENLRWDTRSNNMYDKTRHCKNRGVTYSNSSFTAHDIHKIRKLYQQGYRQADIARMYNRHWNTIHYIVCGHTHKYI